MHATSVHQIIEYSLINNSCMSVQIETQLRLKTGTLYYQLEEFSYKGNSSMQKELSPSGFTFILEVSVVCEVRITKVAAGEPKKNCA